MKVAIETTVMVMMAVIYWYIRVWDEDWTLPEVTALHKAPGTLHCTNSRTAILVSHALKVLLQVLRQCLSTYTTPEIAGEQRKRSNRRNSGNKEHD